VTSNPDQSAIGSSAPAHSQRRARLAWIGGIGGALTGATLVTAAILEGVSASSFDHLTKTCAPNCTTAQVLPVQRESDAAKGLFITGGALAAATIVAVLVIHLEGPGK
jgi:hypothetical protein